MLRGRGKGKGIEKVNSKVDLREKKGITVLTIPPF